MALALQHAALGQVAIPARPSALDGAETTKSVGRAKLEGRAALSPCWPLEKPSVDRRRAGHRQVADLRQSWVPLRRDERRSKDQREVGRTVWAQVGGAGLADEGQKEDFDFQAVPSGQMMVPVMKKGYGAYGGGVTLEKSKLDLSVGQTNKTSPQIEMGGGGNNSNNKNANGGGDGDDGGDDDDYTGGPEDDDDGEDNRFIRRGVIAELFDRASIEAVFQEWFRSVRDLPAGLSRALEMGLISSAQIVRFVSMNSRPTMARTISRIASPSISRGFVGRMLADPGFVNKLVMEQLMTIGAGTYWEVKQRGARLKEEWDLATVNVLTLAACNLLLVWKLSPSRSYGTIARFDWQNAIQKLPNHMFDKSYPLREFNMVSRVSSFFYKAAELSLVGSIAGAASGAAANGIVALKKRSKPELKLSVPVPSIRTSALAFGAFLGLSGNVRYQLLNGADRAMLQHLNSISLAIFVSAVLRLGNNRLGEPSRLAWLGLDGEGASQADAHANAYKRPSLSPQAGFRLPRFSIPSLDSLPTLESLRALLPIGKTSAASSRSTEDAPKRAKRKLKRKVSMAT